MIDCTQRMVKSSVEIVDLLLMPIEMPSEMLAQGYDDVDTMCTSIEPDEF